MLVYVDSITTLTYYYRLVTNSFEKIETNFFLLNPWILEGSDLEIKARYLTTRLPGRYNVSSSFLKL